MTDHRHLTYFIDSELSQQIGRIQGLIPGDLGSGKASLSRRDIELLLSIVLNDTREVLSHSVSNNPEKKKKERKQLWCPLDYKQKVHMELCSKLMACAQRLYITRVGWDALGDQKDSLSRLFDSACSETNVDQPMSSLCEGAPCQVNGVGGSPWMVFIGKNLCWLVTNHLTDDSVCGTKAIEQLLRESGLDPSSTSSSISFFSILKSLIDTKSSKEPPPEDKSELPISILPLIASCAEAFPAGECWTSRSPLYSTEMFPPADALAEDTLYCHSCSPDDVAVIVYLLSILLEVYGKPGGDLDAQSWIILSLIRLTDSTAILYHSWGQKSNALNGVMLAWRRVWRMLLRADLRFRAYTEKAEPNSLGELVILLLSEMVSNNCVDPTLPISSDTSTRNQSFSYENQYQIWCLPAFSNHRFIKVTAPFELLFRILQRVGLSEVGNDVIDATLASSLFDQNFLESTAGSTSRLGRRERLLCFTVASLLNHMNQRLPSESLAEVASACIVALVNGVGDLDHGTLAYGLEDSIRFQLTCSLAIKAFHDACSSSRSSRRLSLWSLLECQQEGISSDTRNVARAIAHRIRHCVQMGRSQWSQFPDFVSETEVVHLQSSVRDFLNKRLCSVIGWTTPDQVIMLEDSFALSDDDPPDRGGVSTTRRLAWKTLAIRVVLTVYLPRIKEDALEEIKTLVPCVVSFLENNISNLSSLCDASDEFLRASTDLRRIINWVTEKSASVHRLAISRRSLDKILEDVKALLYGYSNRMSNGNISFEGKRSSNIEIGTRVAGDDLWDSDEDANARVKGFQEPSNPGDSDDNSSEPCSKRRRVSSSNSNRTSPNPCDEVGAPDWYCAEQLSAIILALDPSSLQYKLVCQALLGTELDMDPSSINGDVDIRSGRCCVGLLNDQVLFHSRALRELGAVHDGVEYELNIDEELPHYTPITMFCRAIELVRAWSRTGFGYETCAGIVVFYENEQWCSSLTEKEVRDIIDVLKANQGAENRPHVRIDRLQAARKAFQAAKKVSRSIFEKDFLDCFVRNSLVDASSNVRRQACIAVGAALRMMDEQTTLRSVQGLIAPLTLSTNPKKVKKEFEVWFQGTDPDIPFNDAEKGMFMDDAFCSMQSDAIYCRAIIAGSARSIDVFRDNLIELLKIPLTRPELEASGFQALEKAASLRGYSKVEDMIEYEAAGILNLWIRSGISLRLLPLAVTAPGVLRNLLYFGHGRCLTSGTGGFDISRIRLEAAKNFTRKYIHFVIPLSLAEIISEKQRPEVDVSSDASLLDLCNLMVEATGDVANSTSVKTILHRHAHDVKAFVLAMIHSGTSEDAGRDTLALLEEAISSEEVQSQSEKNANQVVWRLIELCGTPKGLLGCLPLTEDAYFNAIIEWVDIASSHKTSREDLFLTVGTNFTSCLVLAHHLLHVSFRASDMQQRWESIKLLCSFASNQIHEENYGFSQLGFCLHILLDIILHPRVASVQLSALMTLRDLLNKTLTNLRSALGEEVRILLQRIVSACFHVHESSQRKFISTSCARWSKAHEMLMWSLGLSGMSRFEHDTTGWGWDEPMVTLNGGISQKVHRSVQEYGSTVDTQIGRSITLTYEILDIIASHATSLQLEPSLFANSAHLSETSRAELEALSSLNPKLYAQRLALQFADLHEPNETNLALISNVMKLLSDRHSWTKKTLTTSPLENGNLSFLSMNLEQRLLHSELGKLEQTLRNIRVEKGGIHNWSGKESVDFAALIRELSYVCGASCPDALRFAASRCLGEIEPGDIAELSLMEDTNKLATDWVGEAIEQGKLPQAIRAKGMEIIIECLRSPQSHVAVVASETLEALFTTKDGSEGWKLIADPHRQRLAEPFVHMRKLPGRRLLSPLQSDGIVTAKSINIDDDEEWYLDEKLWCCKETGDRAFEEWVCRLVPAIITWAEKLGHNARHRRRGDKSDFFLSCINMCRLEYRLCETLFPGIVLQLLMGYNESSDPDFARYECYDGHEGAVNQSLTKSFELLMGHSVHGAEAEEDKRRSPPNSRALALAIDTLEILRRVSQHHFLSLDHQRNPITLKDRSLGQSKSPRASMGSPETHIRCLPPPVQWRGIPYGVMLRLNGLEIARSCAQVHRFASALFYIDLHLNARFGESGGIMERLSNDSGISKLDNRFVPCSDISGGLTADFRPSNSQVGCAKEDSLGAIAVMADCFRGLHEEEALEATMMQRSALLFDDRNVVEDIKLDGYSSDLSTLQRLNTISSLNQASLSLSLQIADCMDELGIGRIMHAYLGGLANQQNLAISEDASMVQMIREKWFEGSLHLRQWDTIETLDGNISLENSISRASGDFQFGVGGGFFESLIEALNSYVRQDFDSCRSLMIQCRRCLLGRASLAGVEESSLAAIANVVDRLGAVGDLEKLGTGSMTPSDLLIAWGLEVDKHERTGTVLSHAHDGTASFSGQNYNFSTQTFSSMLREVLLRIFCTRSNDHPNRQRARRGLIHHLWNTSMSARLHGKPNLSEAALKRLVPVIKLAGEDSSESIFRVRLEEAKVLESRGDFMDAIRRCNQVINNLKQSEGDEILNCLTDSLVTCGTWMADYKLQAAKTILDAYLKPGVDLAFKMFEKDQSAPNRDRSVSASLALAQLVANLHESLLTRISSIEWKKRKEDLELQDLELQKCNQLLDTARKKHQRVSKSSKRSSTSPDKLTELTLYNQRLRRDLEPRRKEVENLESSLWRFLNLAVQSFAKTLTLADAGMSTSLADSVFRMVTLWFSGCKDSRDIDNINVLMATFIEEIPTFHFVPLTNQLFSRIEGEGTDEDNRFQKSLQRLVLRMCMDHPYHCIVQLIALSNGKNVGSGVSGRNVSDFLKNVDESKVQAANRLLQKLGKDGQDFIRGLIGSYRIVGEEYINLANASTMDFHEKRTKDIPYSMLNTKARVNLDKCMGSIRRDKLDFPPCVFTSPPPIRPGADYGDGSSDPIGGERIAGFSPTFDVSESGIHRPKIVICHGTGGGKFR